MKYTKSFEISLLTIIEKIGAGLYLIKEAVKDCFRKIFSGKANPTPSMTFDEWKAGRDDFYEVMDLERPYYDKDFDTEKLKESYNTLLRIFLHQGGPVTIGGSKVNPDGEAAKIYAVIDVAYKTLVDSKSRMLYNMRLDIGNPEINPRVDLSWAKWMRAAEIGVILVLAWMVWTYKPLIFSGALVYKALNRTVVPV